MEPHPNYIVRCSAHAYDAYISLQSSVRDGIGRYNVHARACLPKGTEQLSHVTTSILGHATVRDCLRGYSTIAQESLQRSCNLLTAACILSPSVCAPIPSSAARDNTSQVLRSRRGFLV